MKKALAVLALLPLSLAKASLIANVVTDKGTIVVDLQYAKAPKTVANFITMAQATRARLDAVTGEVIKKPLYTGEKFFRVENTASFKILQTGSGTGDATGVPGFTIRDEFDPTLTHVPYVLSMANAGPNTNGGQIFFTGNVTIASLNNVHTVFGLITDPTSRGVIDAILTAGANATTITGVTFNRTDAGAVAFNELAQGLPTLDVPDGSLAVSRKVSSTWNFQTPIENGTVFRAYSINTLASGSWTELTDAECYVGQGDPKNPPPTRYSVQLDAAQEASAFYHLSTARHPNALAPNNLQNHVVVATMGSAVATYTFNATGDGGSVVINTGSGTLNGTFITVDRIEGEAELPRSEGGYDISFVAQHTGITPREVYYRIGCDSIGDTTINGRHSALARSGFPFGFSPFNSGTATISR